MSEISLSQDQWKRLKKTVSNATKFLEASKGSQPIAKELNDLIDEFDKTNKSVVTTINTNELPIEDMDDIMNEIENESKKDEAVTELAPKVAEFVAKPV